MWSNFIDATNDVTARLSRQPSEGEVNMNPYRNVDPGMAESTPGMWLPAEN